jgi:hypothetical protein
MMLLLSINTIVFAQPANEWNSEKYTVILENIDALTECNDNKIFNFKMYNKPERKTESFQVCNLTQKIIDLFIVNDLIVIFGKIITNDIDAITIIDMIEKKEKDLIICYHPQLLLNNNILIYEKFYPRFSPIEVMSSLILFYNLNNSPQENRINKIDIEKFNEMKSGCPRRFSEYYENVGLPIYPTRNYKDKTYRVWLEKHEERHDIISPKYAVDTKENMIFFIDHHDNETSIISVDLQEGYKNLKLKKYLLNIAVNTDRNILDIEEFYVDNNGALNVNITLSKIQKQKKLQIPLSDFVNIEAK